MWGGWLLLVGIAQSDLSCLSSKHVNLWIHQDATSSFYYVSKHAAEVLAPLMAIPTLDLGYSLFRDRDADSDYCFAEVVNSATSDYSRKRITGEIDMALRIEGAKGGGGDDAEDAFSALPHIASELLPVHDSLKYIAIVTDAKAKYHRPGGDLESFEGSRPIERLNHTVTCDPEYLFPTLDAIFAPLLERNVTPIILIPENARATLEPWYAAVLAEAGLDPSSGRSYIRTFDDLTNASTVGSALESVLMEAACTESLSAGGPAARSVGLHSAQSEANTARRRRKAPQEFDFNAEDDDDDTSLQHPYRTPIVVGATAGGMAALAGLVAWYTARQAPSVATAPPEREVLYDNRRTRPLETAARVPPPTFIDDKP